ncbi:FecR family protein [Kordiimonas lipolytica]|uniref:FecR family protein n=1 Tax=Kordiimonas lipolytica TaxID=1662421 RepID=A0ABV8U969_9PROT|nr:FecR domain-containing protein [Kordiimonas lipolytica]
MPKSRQIEKKVLDQAAEYYLDLQDGTMGAEELKAWQGWMAADGDHRRAFARMETLWGVLGEAQADDWRDLAAQTETDMAAGEGQATVAVHPSAGGSILSMVAPATEQPSVRKKPAYAWVGAIAASFAAVLVATFLLMGSPESGQAVRTLHYQTAAGQQRVINLTDGSIVELGAGSSVSVTYSEEDRSLTLDQGEAVFTVAKNPKRPFIVRAGQGSVTAIGTVFNVRKSDTNVEVRVLEGTVAVRPIDDTADRGRSRGRDASSAVTQPVALVTAGRQTAYSPAGRMMPIIEANVHEGLSWRVGVLTMVDWPIADVIQELNRYLTDEITIGDEAVGTMRFTGTVYPDQVDAWLEGLQQGYPIEVVRLGGSTILMFDEEQAGT